MKKNIERAITLTCLAGAFISAIFFVREEAPYLESELESKKIAVDYVSEAETEPEVKRNKETERTDAAPLGMKIDFSGLQELNKDIVGWIYIPGTQVNYPVLQHPEDNTYYLRHTPAKKENILGSIYMYAEASSDFSAPHSILFGHNMASGQQFGELSNYADKKFRDEYPYVYIFLPDRSMRCEVYSAYSCSVDDITYTVGYGYGTREFAEFAAYTKTQSVWRTENGPSESDFIITLSTCTDEGDASRRFVVNCVLAEDRQIDQEENRKECGGMDKSI